MGHSVQSRQHYLLCMSSLKNISLGIFTVIILFITVRKNIVLLSFRYVVDYNMLNLLFLFLEVFGGASST